MIELCAGVMEYSLKVWARYLKRLFCLKQDGQDDRYEKHVT